MAPSKQSKSSRLTVRIQGFGSVGFVYVEGMGGAIDVVEFKDGPDTTVRKRPGRTAYDPVTLRRERPGKPLLWGWWKECAEGGGRRRTVTLSLEDDRGRALATWELGGCWPVRWRLVDVGASEKDAVHVEEITVVVEDVQLE